MTYLLYVTRGLLLYTYFVHPHHPLFWQTSVCSLYLLFFCLFIYLFILGSTRERSYDICLAIPDGLDGKASAHRARDPDSIPGPGRSPGGENGNPLQYSCLENSMVGGAWWATVRGVTKSRT